MKCVDLERLAGVPLSRLRTLWAASGFLAIVACAGPTANENFYALNDGAVVISATPAVGSQDAPRRSSLPGIVVSAITIPELIDRPQIVTRDSGNRVIVSEQNLWAESIELAYPP